MNTEYKYIWVITFKSGKQITGKTCFKDLKTLRRDLDITGIKDVNSVVLHVEPYPELTLPYSVATCTVDYMDVVLGSIESVVYLKEK